MGHKGAKRGKGTRKGHKGIDSVQYMLPEGVLRDLVFRFLVEGSGLIFVLSLRESGEQGVPWLSRVVQRHL